jgi:lipoate-protein ligase A
MSPTLPHWAFVDSGPQSAEKNMADDRAALEALTNGPEGAPRLRFFEWTDPVVTFGYLLDENLVRQWAQPFEPVDVVKRPTGGGAVYHTPTDLSLSLLWPRHAGVLPDRPQACYAAIHEAFRHGVAAYLGQAAPTLFTPAASVDDKPAAAERFSACFQKPVCDDVMLDDKKVIGGALRLTRKAILYQGAVQMGAGTDLEKLKAELRKALKEALGI